MKRATIPILTALLAVLPLALRAAAPVVGALTETSRAEQAKKAVLRVAAGRAESVRASGDEARAAILDAEIAAVAARPAAEMAAARPDAQNLSVLAPPRSVEGNPFLDQLVAGARAAVAKGDVAWPVAAPDKPLLGTATSQGEYNPRDTAARMEALLWLYANPASPMRGDPDVLEFFLRRALAYADAIVANPDCKGGQMFFDDFAIAPASCALREFARLHPGLLLPSQQDLLDRAMRIAGDRIMAYSAQHRDHFSKGGARIYANIHLAMAFQLLNFGLYLDDRAMLDRSQELLASLGGAVLPDGGTHYIWSQNESCGYHDTIAHFLARIYEVSGNPLALDLLKRLEWYGPVSTGRLAEYWTAPSWKHTWNSDLQGIAGGEYVAAVTGNPYVRGILGTPSFKPGDLRRWEQARSELPWYRDDIPAKPVPDEVTYPDRNIDGPRARYGRFSYAATLRDIPLDEPGHTTLMGAMIMQPDFSMQVFLMGAFPRVRMGSNPADPKSMAWLTSGMTSSRVIARRACALSASYDLAAPAGSLKGDVLPWTGRQVWLGLPDRLVAWMEVSPTTPEATAREIQNVIRIGTGGTVNGPAQVAREAPPGEWSYGDLIVRVVGHSDGQLAANEVPFRVPAFPVTEISLSAPPPGPAWMLVEIRPSWTAAPADIRMVPSPVGTTVFEVGLPDHSYVVAANFSRSEASIGGGQAARKSSLFLSGREAPADAKDPAFALAPGQTALLIRSEDPRDHLPGWKSFQDLVAEDPGGAVDGQK